jgi:hypothetical protein
MKPNMGLAPAIGHRQAEIVKPIMGLAKAIGAMASL